MDLHYSSAHHKRPWGVWACFIWYFCVFLSIALTIISGFCRGGGLSDGLPHPITELPLGEYAVQAAIGLGGMAGAIPMMMIRKGGAKFLGTTLVLALLYTLATAHPNNRLGFVECAIAAAAFLYAYYLERTGTLISGSNGNT